MAIEPIYMNNDHFMELTGFQDGVTLAFLNAATVTVTIYATDGAALGDATTGISWPLTMDYLSGSDGVYQAVIDKAISLTRGELYKAVITAAESGIDGEWNITLRAQERD